MGGGIGIRNSCMIMPGIGLREWVSVRVWVRVRVRVRGVVVMLVLDLVVLVVVRVVRVVRWCFRFITTMISGG